MLERLGADVTDLGILKDDPAALAQAIAGGGARPRSGADLGRRLDRRGRSRAQRGREDRPAGVLARRDQARPAGGDGRDPGRERGTGAAFVGLPGNPVAVFVTFARVVRPLLLRLAGAQPEPLTALPVRLAFRLPEEEGPARIRARRAAPGADGTIEAVKHPQEGAGVITSLTETDGLAELTEDATTVEPGSTVGFLSYATLMG